MDPPYHATNWCHLVMAGVLFFDQYFKWPPSGKWCIYSYVQLLEMDDLANLVLVSI